MAVMRLDRYLADAGYGTRSQVKNIIRQHRVLVDGGPARSADTRIDTESTCVKVDGKDVLYASLQYYMLNKPAGVVSAVKDEKDKTVIGLIDEKKRRDLFPVGRLDKDTEGLLLITNDGKMSYNLLAPGKHVEKEYLVRVRGVIDEDTKTSFSEGVDIGDERKTSPAVLSHISHTSKQDTEYSEAHIVITEGRYHQIKRMFEAVGMEVVYLKRLRMGELLLDEALRPGEYRTLTDEEIMLLAGGSTDKERK